MTEFTCCFDWEKQCCRVVIHPSEEVYLSLQRTPTHVHRAMCNEVPRVIFVCYVYCTEKVDDTTPDQGEPRELIGL